MCSGLLIFYASKIESITSFFFGFMAQVPQTIEIVQAGKNTIEVIVYVLTGVATIVGIIKGWGYFKTNREKKKSLIEENTEMLNHIKDITDRVKDSQSDVLDISTKSYSEIMRLKSVINEKDLELMKIKKQCKNSCYVKK